MGQIGWADLLGQGVLLPSDSIGVQLAFVVIASSAELPGRLAESWAEVSGAMDIYGQWAAKGEGRLPLRLTAPRIDVGKQIDGGVASIGLGSPVTYTILLTNSGDTTLARIGVRDIFEPGHLRFVSASISPPVLQNRDNRGVLYWEDVTGDLGTIAPGATVSFTTMFVVEGEGSQTTNQVEVAGVVDEFGDDVVGVSGEASLTVKLAALALHLSSTPVQGSAVDGGDLITYTLHVSNTGGIDLFGVWLRTEVPTNTEYVAGSAQPPAAEARGPNAERLWRVPDLVPGALFVAQYTVQVKPNEFGFVISRAEVGSDQTPVSRRAVILHSSLPTAVELRSFTAMMRPAGVVLEWTTGVEIGSWGFFVWRSEKSDLSQGRRMGNGMIPATGGSGGAFYQFVDQEARSNQLYWYWLEEIEIDGDRHFYGPIRHDPAPASAGGYLLFLPIFAK